MNESITHKSNIVGWLFYSGLTALILVGSIKLSTEIAFDVGTPFWLLVIWVALPVFADAVLIIASGLKHSEKTSKNVFIMWLIGLGVNGIITGIAAAENPSRNWGLLIAMVAAIRMIAILKTVEHVEKLSNPDINPTLTNTNQFRIIVSSLIAMLFLFTEYYVFTSTMSGVEEVLGNMEQWGIPVLFIIPGIFLLVDLMVIIVTVGINLTFLQRFIPYGTLLISTMLNWFYLPGNIGVSIGALLIKTGVIILITYGLSKWSLKRHIEKEKREEMESKRNGV